jgi:hypothetical protein
MEKMGNEASLFLNIMKIRSDFNSNKMKKMLGIFINEIGKADLRFKLKKY